jgi:hypothetical protein
MENINQDIRGLLASLSECETDISKDPKVLRTAKKIVENMPDSILDSQINIYPGGIPGRCHDTLLVVIGENDDVEKNVLQAVEHVSAKCRGITTNVIFWAVWWSSFHWPDHKASFRGINVVLKVFFADPALMKT